MRFEILELVKYDKTAAEILVDAVADNEVKFKLLNKVWKYIDTVYRFFLIAEPKEFLKTFCQKCFYCH